MEQLTWIFWVILGVALIVAETFTLGFVLLWFGIGALAAGVAGILGVGILGQFLIFAAVSVVLTALSRTIFSNFLALKGDDSVRMGMDALPGQVGTVSTASKGALNEAAVKVYGSTWTAYPEDSDIELVEGEKVEVVSVKGSSIYVRPITKHLPDWRGD